MCDFCEKVKSPTTPPAEAIQILSDFPALRSNVVEDPKLPVAVLVYLIGAEERGIRSDAVRNLRERNNLEVLEAIAPLSDAEQSRILRLLADGS